MNIENSSFLEKIVFVDRCLVMVSVKHWEVTVKLSFLFYSCFFRSSTQQNCDTNRKHVNFTGSVVSLHRWFSHLSDHWNVKYETKNTWKLLVKCTQRAFCANALVTHQFVYNPHRFICLWVLFSFVLLLKNWVFFFCFLLWVMWAYSYVFLQCEKDWKLNKSKLFIVVFVSLFFCELSMSKRERKKTRLLQNLYFIKLDSTVFYMLFIVCHSHVEFHTIDFWHESTAFLFRLSSHCWHIWLYEFKYWMNMDTYLNEFYRTQI